MTADENGSREEEEARDRRGRVAVRVQVVAIRRHKLVEAMAISKLYGRGEEASAGLVVLGGLLELFL